MLWSEVKREWRRGEQKHVRARAIARAWGTSCCWCFENSIGETEVFFATQQTERKSGNREGGAKGERGVRVSLMRGGATAEGVLTRRIFSWRDREGARRGGREEGGWGHTSCACGCRRNRGARITSKVEARFGTILVFDLPSCTCDQVTLWQYLSAGVWDKQPSVQPPSGHPPPVQPTSTHIDALTICKEESLLPRKGAEGGGARKMEVAEAAECSRFCPRGSEERPKNTTPS